MDAAIAAGALRTHDWDATLPPSLRGALGEAAVASLMSHPDYWTAHDMAANHALKKFHGNWLMNRLLNDRGRVVTTLLMLDLHYGAGSQGVTGAQIRREVQTYGICSPGRATAFLSALRFAQYLKVAPGGSGRERRLVPTEAFLDLDRDRWRKLIPGVCLMQPSLVARIREVGETLLMEHCTRLVAQLYREGVRVVDVVPHLRDVSERDAGLTMIMTLAAEGKDGRALSTSNLSRRFAVSRTHVKDVMQMAEEAGFAISSEGSYSAGPRLRVAVGRFWAVLMLVVIAACAVAEAALQEGAASGPVTRHISA